MKATIEANGLIITVEQDPHELKELEDPEFFTKAVVTMIEQAPTSWWEKDYGFESPSVFVAAILAALAQTYAFDDFHDDDRLKLPSGDQVSKPWSRPLHEYLPVMLGHLKDAGLLDRIIKSNPDDEDAPDEENLN